MVQGQVARPIPRYIALRTQMDSYGKSKEVIYGGAIDRGKMMKTDEGKRMSFKTMQQQERPRKSTGCILCMAFSAPRLDRRRLETKQCEAQWRTYFRISSVEEERSDPSRVVGGTLKRSVGRLSLAEKMISEAV